MLQEILQKWKKKTRRAPTEAAEIQLTPAGCLRLVTSHGHAAESVTSVLGEQDTRHKCFPSVGDLPLGNKS